MSTFEFEISVSDTQFAYDILHDIGRMRNVTFIASNVFETDDDVLRSEIEDVFDERGVEYNLNVPDDF